MPKGKGYPPKKGKKKGMALLAGLALAGLAGQARAFTVSCTQVEVAGAADVVSTASLVRQYVTVKAHNANTDEVYCEEGTATATTGFELGAGDGVTWGSDIAPLDNSVSLSCIAGSGTQRVSVCENLR